VAVAVQAQWPPLPGIEGGALIGDRVLKQGNTPLINSERHAAHPDF